MKLPRFRLSLDSSIRTPFLLSYLFATVTCFLTVGFFLQLQPQVPLFYTLAEPSSQLAPKAWLFLLPSSALAISFFHTLIAQSLHTRGRVVAKLFAWSTVVVQFLLCSIIVRTLLITT